MKFIFAFITFLTTALTVYAGIKEADYEVPTSQSNLKSAAVFKIEKLLISRNSDNNTTIKYMVPVELTGLKNEIEFSGALNRDGGNFNSEYGNMNCLVNTKKMMCTVSYQKLNFDTVLAKNILAEKFTGSELDNRLTVQEKFSTDPIGIIHIYLKSNKIRTN